MISQTPFVLHNSSVVGMPVNGVEQPQGRTQLPPHPFNWCHRLETIKRDLGSPALKCLNNLGTVVDCTLVLDRMTL